MSNTWVMEYVNSTSGHVQLGEFIMIPEDERSSSYDLWDETIGDTFELCDLSNMVPVGTTAVYGYLAGIGSSANDRFFLLTRGHGGSAGEGSAPFDYPRVVTLWLHAQLGAYDIRLGTPVVINAPGGKFEYKRYNVYYPLDAVQFTLWGYYVK